MSPRWPSWSGGSSTARATRSSWPTTGPAAWSWPATGRPDLILLDINLGKFSPDGFEVNRRLKDDPATRPIPVIALTAHADWTEHRDKAAREGFVDHIIKPIDFELLLKRIAVVLHPEGGT
jgi:CheY-like chemotaxis protein